MSDVQFSHRTLDDGQEFITVFARGRLLPPVDSTHPNFYAIKALVAGTLYGSLSEADVDQLIDLFDVAQTIAKHFSTVSDRVKIGHGVVLLDGEEIDNSLTKQILRFMDEGVDDWKPLVAFFEKVLSNPNEHSRSQLFGWLNKHDFTITQDGDVVGYKGVESDGAGGYRSVSSGREQVLVDGKAFTGKIPNPLGAEIEMSRSLVQHDPSVGCHIGLHVGTFEYASTWTSVGEVLEVHVNPRDVVSVPTDCNWSKVRVCRYKVVDAVERKYDCAVLGADADNSTDLDLDNQATGTKFEVGDTVYDPDGDVGKVVEVCDDEYLIAYSEPTYPDEWWDEEDLSSSDPTVDEEIEDLEAQADDLEDEASSIRAAAESLRNAKGQFHQGRPGSQRGSDGKFC